MTSVLAIAGGKISSGSSLGVLWGRVLSNLQIPQNVQKNIILTFRDFRTRVKDQKPISRLV